MALRAAGTFCFAPALAFTSTLPARGTVYEVGDALPFPTIGSVPWESLEPGDTVRIHHRAADYHEKWVLCRRGTASQPIVVQGVPSSSGVLPVINGIDATTRSQLD